MPVLFVGILVIVPTLLVSVQDAHYILLWTEWVPHLVERWSRDPGWRVQLNIYMQLSPANLIGNRFSSVYMHVWCTFSSHATLGLYSKAGFPLDRGNFSFFFFFTLVLLDSCQDKEKFCSAWKTPVSRKTGFTGYS